MNQFSKRDKILAFTNDKDAMVRMEAQTAMVRMQGYEGLQFFDTLTYPLSEWHQLNLLHLLGSKPLTAETPVFNWLKSVNPTVIQFALKLIAEQHASEYEPQVLECLAHTADIVRREAILCLGQIPSATSSEVLKNQFNTEGNKNIRLSIINEFKRAGSVDDLSFLEELMLAEDKDIQLAAHKAVLSLQ